MNRTNTVSTLFLWMNVCMNLTCYWHPGISCWLCNPKTPSPTRTMKPGGVHGSSSSLCNTIEEWTIVFCKLQKLKGGGEFGGWIIDTLFSPAVDKNGLLQPWWSQGLRHLSDWQHSSSRGRSCCCLLDNDKTCPPLHCGGWGKQCLGSWSPMRDLIH